MDQSIDQDIRDLAMAVFQAAEYVKGNMPGGAAMASVLASRVLSRGGQEVSETYDTS